MTGRAYLKANRATRHMAHEVLCNRGKDLHHIDAYSFKLVFRSFATKQEQMRRGARAGANSCG